MKIGLGQIQICWEDREGSLRKVEQCMNLLQNERTDLFLLPEMSLTGFSMRTEYTKEQGETIGLARELADKYGMAVGIGWVKDAGERCENHYSLVSQEGTLLDYAKLHPFRYGGETQMFQGGTEIPVCRFGDFRIGVQICYDLRFPEPFQILSRQADLILVPANWPASRREHWDCLLRARAIENQVYVAGVNCAGRMEKQYYSGDSGIYRPDGSFLPAGKKISIPDGCPEEVLLCYEMDCDVERYRCSFPTKEDRRENLYRKYYAGGN